MKAAEALGPLRALLHAKGRMALHGLASVRRESRLKVAVVAGATVLLWLGAYHLFRGALEWLQIFGGEALGTLGFSAGNLLTGRLLSTLALVLLLLLALSSVLVTFATLYRSREVAFLLTAPLSYRTLFLGRFLEAAVLSSWASAFLGSPLLVALGRTVEAPPLFYLGLAAIYPLFALVPASLGALLALLAVRVLPIVGRGGLLALGAAGLGGFFVLVRGRLSALTPGGGANLESLLSMLGRAEHPALPSQWAVTAVLELAAGRPGAAVLPSLYLLGAAAAGVAGVTALAGWLFFPGWSALRSVETRRRSARGGSGRVGVWLGKLLHPLPEPYRSLVRKDLLVFWRDPAQWSQFLLFFGILALYAATMRRSSPAYDAELWRGLIALLNGTVGLLILATLTTRFLFPAISLEGRRAWILGLAPITWRQIQRQKLWLGVAATSGFTLLITLVTGLRLRLDGGSLLVSLFTVGATNLALAGLAVGLGSLYASFDEDNPSRIVSGLGGTLNFILSMGFVVLAGIVQGALLQWPLVARRTGLPEDSLWPTALGLGTLGLLAALTCWVPLRLGLRRLERLEL